MQESLLSSIDDDENEVNILTLSFADASLEAEFCRYHTAAGRVYVRVFLGFFAVGTFLNAIAETFSNDSRHTLSLLFNFGFYCGSAVILNVCARLKWSEERWQWIATSVLLFFNLQSIAYYNYSYNGSGRISDSTENGLNIALNLIISSFPSGIRFRSFLVLTIVTGTLQILAIFNQPAALISSQMIRRESQHTMDSIVLIFVLLLAVSYLFEMQQRMSYVALKQLHDAGIEANTVNLTWRKAIVVLFGGDGPREPSFFASRASAASRISRASAASRSSRTSAASINSCTQPVTASHSMTGLRRPSQLPRSEVSAADSSRNYRLIDSEQLVFETEIGRGASGIVWRGEYQQTDGSDKHGTIKVAIKQIHLSVYLMSEQLQEAKKEAMILSGLQHPHVVRFYGISLSMHDTSPGLGAETASKSPSNILPSSPNLLLVTELCTHSLEDLLCSGSYPGGCPKIRTGTCAPTDQRATGDVGDVDEGRPTVDISRRREHQDWVVTVLLQVARAMEYLHTQMVVHCDLKPGNILTVKAASTSTATAPDFIAKVCDFGSASKLRRKQRTNAGSLVGTPVYMAPELLRAEFELAQAGQQHTGQPKFDFSIDSYSFGVLIWSIWTGQLPYEQSLSNGFFELMRRIALEGQRPPIPPEMPSCLAVLMTRCWDNEAHIRPNFHQIRREIEAMDLA
jgi:serine/threonine protein kinase